MTQAELRELHARLKEMAETSHNYERQISVIQATATVELAASAMAINETLMEIRDAITRVGGDIQRLSR